MPKNNRREFLKKTAAASAVFPLFTIAGTKASGKVLGANDTIRVGVVGVKGRGGGHISEFLGQDKVEISHLIDVDTRQFRAATRKVEGAGRPKPVCVQDVRQALEDPNLDAISVATCNHTHSLITVWACQAGKDVYVEKPISHNVFEGRKCVEAAEAYGRVVQHGTQQRSSQSRSNEIAAVQSGNYGKLLVSKGYCCKPRWSIGFKPHKDPPPELDFNVWLGPAPLQPFHENLVHYNWHWFWDFGNGDTGNQGVHEIDVARWAIKDGTLPKRVWSLGGRFGYVDQGQTPNTQLSVYEYDDALLIFETRGLVGKHEGFPRMVHNEYYTTDGMITRGKFYPKNGGDPEPVQGEGRQVTPGGPFGAFVTAMRTRRPEDNNADAEVAHYSAALCHLGNISYRLGSAVPFDAKNKAIGDNKQVVEALATVKANCAAVGMDLQESSYQLGRTLKFDPLTERFVGDDEANAMLTRNYRAPFVVPEQV